MQQVVIIFLLCDAAGPTLQLCFNQLFVSRNVGHTVQKAFWNQRSVADSLCRHQPFDSVSAFSSPLCLQCLFDVTLQKETDTIE